MASPVADTEAADPNPNPIADAHKKCTDDDGNPVWCTQPGAHEADGKRSPPAAEMEKAEAAKAAEEKAAAKEEAAAKEKAAAKAGGAAQEGGAKAGQADPAAPERKCTDEAGEPAWCNGAPPGTQVADAG